MLSIYHIVKNECNISTEYEGFERENWLKESTVPWPWLARWWCNQHRSAASPCSS